MLRFSQCPSLLAFPAASLADFISFDEPQFAGAPADFHHVTPGGPYGPAISVNGVSFTGGVVLNGSGFADEETTTPNLYATSDNAQLANGSMLPGSITAALMNPASSVSLDIENGNNKADFTLSGYSASASLLASDMIELNFIGFPARSAWHPSVPPWNRLFHRNERSGRRQYRLRNRQRVHYGR